MNFVLRYDINSLCIAIYCDTPNVYRQLWHETTTQQLNQRINDQLLNIWYFIVFVQEISQTA